ncbi:MAG: hypothetical protein WBQ26_13685 [Gemmatimonadaceae bacterium]|nr:hypothetical protein [Gemmatimonadaceae bacterium]
MADPPVPIPRPPLDRAALERVLARAAELQASSGEPADTMTDAQILDLGKEVGLSSQVLRQALAEERTRRDHPQAPGLVFGSTVVTAERTVRGTAENVFSALDVWMQKEEWLQIKRQFPDRIIWEPRRDFEGGVRRLFNVGGRGYALSKATDVGATVVPADEGRVLVRLDADLSGQRRNAIIGLATATTFGTAASAVAIALHFALVVVPVPLLAAGAISYFAARGAYTSAVSRAQLALEQTLDRLERGERADNPSLLKLLAQAASTTARRY